ncbi:MAG: hypothetical protein J5805_03190 [Bacteroidaceae bacterium]|nr:hypothetical protein [Bacteroidaceae bacterium]
MKKILYILLIIVFITSCTSNNSSNETYEDTRFEEMMYEFYQNHLRYPRSSSDYCRMVYVYDSLNDFDFARLMSEIPTAKLESYNRYNQFMDSVHIALDGIYGTGSPYFSWQLFYRNMSDDDMEYTNGKIIYHNQDDGCTYYAYDMMNSINDWILNKKSLEDFDVHKMIRTKEFLCFRMCSKDSVFIKFPKKVFNKYKAQKDVWNMVDSVTMSIQDRMPHKRLLKYGIRYHRNGKIEPIDNRRKLPQEIVNCKPLLHYMDSCINIDNRVEFVQFYFVKRFCDE